MAGFDFSKIIEASVGPLITSVLSGGAGIYGNRQAEQSNIRQGDRELQQQKDLLLFKKSLEDPAAGGGGGGGGGGPFLGFTDPQRVQALSNQNSDTLAALQQLINAYQGPLLSR